MPTNEWFSRAQARLAFRNGQNIEGVKRLNLGEGMEVGVVKGQEPGDVVLDHERHQTNIVGVLALNGVLGDQAFPGGIDLGCFGQKLKEGAGGGDFGAGLGAVQPKPLALAGRVQTTYIS